MRLLAIVCVVAGLAVTAVAEAQTVAGKLSKRDARAFIIRQMRPDAPAVLLKDARGGFYRTSKLTVAKAAKCERHSEAEVDCGFTAVLAPDAAHRKANWQPIRCTGAVRAMHLTNGALAGAVQDYTCTSIPPKKPKEP